MNFSNVCFIIGNLWILMGTFTKDFRYVFVGCAFFISGLISLSLENKSEAIKRNIDRLEFKMIYDKMNNIEVMLNEK